MTCYQQYKKDVITDRVKSIHDVIKKNSLALFSSPKQKKKSKSSLQLAVQRNNTSLFGRLYIANQQHNGAPAKFFPHENQTTPPSLSDFGKLRTGQKSILLSCLSCSDETPHSLFDCKIFDGAAVVHFLPSKTANTFSDYADQIFIPFIQHQLQDTNRVDFVWDCYFERSIKGMTRDQRGSGVRTKVSLQTKMPKKWDDFLRDSQNKTELFFFLTARVGASTIVSENKTLFMTIGMLLIPLMYACMPYLHVASFFR